MFFWYIEQMNRICVYCGSSAGSNEIYRLKAAELAAELARRGIEIINGGGQVGLMGVVSDAALAAGGKVCGIIPGFLDIKEVAHEGLSRMITVESMHERKALMAEMSDAFIALPGGFGTLDEIFEILTWSQLGLHRKPAGILNINGYFDPVIAQLDRMVEEGFLRVENRELLCIAYEIDELLGTMAAFEAPLVPKWL